MLTQERLKELLHYDPDTGEWTWLVGRGGGDNGAHPGDRAGWIENGRRRIQVDAHKYLASRLAVLYMTGAWPAKQVDHRDLDKSNDRWSNLRDATHNQNSMNIGKRRDNTSGFKGVTLHAETQKWHARICLMGKSRSLGLFGTPEAAHDAYVDAASKLFGEFARAG